MKFRYLLAGLAALSACTTGGGGGADPTAVQQPPPTGQVWCLGDSRSVGTSSFIGWGHYVPSCTLYGEGGAGFVQQGIYHSSIPEAFVGLVQAHGAPAKVYVSLGINDSNHGIDARPAMIAFHDELTRMGVEQVWATSPYAAPYVDPAVNARQEQLNAAMTWAKDCAGLDPSPAASVIVDGTGVHQDTEFNKAFAACIQGH